MSRVERISLELRARADSRGGVLGMFTWAFAEALVWPVIPDAALSLLVAARPRRWWPLAAAAVVGTLMGGVVGVVARGAGWAWPLPLTTSRMHAAVEQWLDAGAGALAHQPLSGVPYKVFVAGAAEAGISVGAFALGTLQYRGPRLVAVAALTALVAGVAWRLVPSKRQASVHVLTTALAAAAVVAGLAAVVASWS